MLRTNRDISVSWIYFYDSSIYIYLNKIYALNYIEYIHYGILHIYEPISLVFLRYPLSLSCYRKANIARLHALVNYFFLLLIISLNFAAISKYNCDMYEAPPETARERATRIWRNAWIQGRTEIHQEETSNIEEERHLNQFKTKLVRSIKEILADSKHIQSVEHYLALIQYRKRKLLMEKLKRLEASQREHTT
jgi:hypothetical protein